MASAEAVVYLTFHPPAGADPLESERIVSTENLRFRPEFTFERLSLAVEASSESLDLLLKTINRLWRLSAQLRFHHGEISSQDFSQHLATEVSQHRAFLDELALNFVATDQLSKALKCRTETTPLIVLANMRLSFGASDLSNLTNKQIDDAATCLSELKSEILVQSSPKDGEPELPAVRLGEGDSREAWVFNRPKGEISKREAKFLRVLVNSFPERMKGELIESEGQGSDAAHVLKRLKERDSDWQAAILLAGAAYGGYGIAPMSSDPQKTK